AQLGVNFPRHGGAFVWARAFHYDSLAFIAGCCYVGQGIVGVSVVSLVFAHYSAQFVPGLPVHLAAGAIVLAVVALNSFGIAFTSKIIISLMLVIVSLLGVYVVFLAPHVESSRLTPAFENGPVELTADPGICFWPLDAFVPTPSMGTATKHP